MTQWTAFVGVTGLVLSLFLGLARLSQGAVSGDAGSVDDAHESRNPDGTTDSDGVETVRSTHVAAPADPADREASRQIDVGRTADRTSAGRAIPDSGSGGDDSPPVRTTDSDTDGDDHGDPADPAVMDEPAAAAPETDAEPPDESVESPPIAATTAGVEGSDRPGTRAMEGMDLSPGMLLANVALTQGVFGVAVAAAALYFAIPPAALGLSGDPLSTGLPAVGVGVAFGVVLWLGNELASVLAESAGVAYDETLREVLAPDSLAGWALLLGGVLPLIAGVEELLFRAAAVGVPAAAYGVSPWALAVVSSLAFALGHGAQGRTGMVVTGALGFALAAGFVLTNSLVVVVVAHYLVNALEFLVHEGLGVDRPFG